MSTTLATPSPNNAKIRFGETYVSEGLNRKMFAAIPAGIIRGGKLLTTGAGLNVKIDPDPNTGDSVYTFADINGHQLTFRDVGTRTLDLSGGGVPTTTVFIALFISYAVSSPTVVEWRTYTQAELDAAPEGGVVVIVGKVVVPGAGPIDPSAVTPDGRREAWKDQSSGTRPWKQIVKNGSFNEGLGSVSPTVQSIAGYTGVESGGSLSVDATSPRSGLYSLKYVSTSTVDFGRLGPGQFAVANPFSGGLIPVRAGQLIDAQFYLSGNSVEAYAAGTSGARLILEVYDAAGALIGSAVQAESDPAVHVGNFAYDRVEKIFAAPGDGYLRWYLDLSIDAGAGTGEFYVDDVRIFLSPGDTANEDDGSQPVLTEPVVRATALEIAPRNAASDTEASDRVAKFVADIIGGRSVLSLIDGGGLVPQIGTSLEHGGIDKDKDTFGIIGTDKTAANETMPTDYKLVHRYQLDGSISGRVYTKATSPGAFVFTVNAGWVGGGLDRWEPDLDSVPAYKLSLVSGSGAVTSRGLHLEQKDDVTPSSWLDTAWDAKTIAQESTSAIVPVFKGTKTSGDDPGGPTAWKLIYEWPTASGTRAWRLYTGNGQDGHVCFTENAVWDPTVPQWTADVGGATEHALIVGFVATATNARVVVKSKLDTSSPWSDAAWDTDATGTGLAVGMSIAGEYEFAAAKSRTRVVNLMRFTNLGATGWDLTAAATFRWISAANLGVVLAPIDVPIGYILQRVRCLVKKGAGSTDQIRCSLNRHDTIDFAAPAIGALTIDTKDTVGAVAGELQTVDLDAGMLPRTVAVGEEYFVGIQASADGAANPDELHAVLLEYTQSGVRG